MPYYFNGGIYESTSGKDEFDAVRPGGGLPYVTESSKGTKGCEHHSSVYKISDDFTSAVMEHSNYFVGHPYSIKLNKKLSDELKLAVEKLKGKK